MTSTAQQMYCPLFRDICEWPNCAPAWHSCVSNNQFATDATYGELNARVSLFINCGERRVLPRAVGHRLRRITRPNQGTIRLLQFEYKYHKCTGSDIPKLQKINALIDRNQSRCRVRAGLARSGLANTISDEQCEDSVA
jgi:hypothetical protein